MERQMWLCLNCGYCGVVEQETILNIMDLVLKDHEQMSMTDHPDPCTETPLLVKEDND